MSCQACFKNTCNCVAVAERDLAVGQAKRLAALIEEE